MNININTSADLKKNIISCWTGELYNQSTTRFVHLDIARSTPHLIIHYEGSFRSSPIAGVFGQTTYHKQYISQSQKSGIIGIQLSCTAIPSLFHIPACEITNRCFDITDIFGKKGKELIEKVISAKSNDKRGQLITDFFEKQFKPVKKKYLGINYAIKYINTLNGIVDINQLTNIACLSPRQFERNFKEITGFSASTYIRIIRFEKAIKKYSTQNRNLTNLYLDCGYYDQSHFNHDFKIFTGLSPSQYFKNFYYPVL